MFLDETTAKATGRLTRLDERAGTVDNLADLLLDRHAAEVTR